MTNSDKLVDQLVCEIDRLRAERYAAGAVIREIAQHMGIRAITFTYGSPVQHWMFFESEDAVRVSEQTADAIRAARLVQP